MALNDPTTAPDAKDPDNDFQSQFERCMKGSYPYLGRMHADSATRYEAEDAAAKEAELAAGDPGAPSPVGDPGATPPDVTPGAPGAAAPEPERHEAAAPGAASGPAAASGTNTVVPALGGEKDKDKKKDEEPSRMARDAEAIRYSRLEARSVALEKENADLREKEARAVAEKNVTQLVAEGIKLDPDKEVLRFMKLDEPARYERMAEIRGNWKRDAYGAAPPPPLDFNHYGAPAKPGSGAGREGELKRYSREQVDKAVALAQEKAIPYERALEEVAAA